MAAVWSCDPATSLDYPARYLFTFLEHHGMLGIFGSPEWRTVTGGSGTYVAAVAEQLPEIRLGTKVTSVRRDDPRRRRDGRQRRHLVVRRRRDRHAPVAGAEHARVPHRAPARGPRRDPLLAQHRAAAHRHLAAAGCQGGALVVELPAPGRRDRCGDRDLRPHPPAAAAHRHALPRDPRRRAPRRPGHRDRPDGVRAPALHPRVRRRAGSPAGDRHRPDRLRRRLPRLGLPRGRRALRAGRRHPARAVVGAPRDGRPRPHRALRDDHPAHASYAVHAQLRAPLDLLARRPRRPARPRPARPLRGARPPRRPGQRRCAATSRRSSPTTASPWAPEPAPAGS